MSQIWDIAPVKPARFHPGARAVIQDFPEEVRRELGKAIFDIQKGKKRLMSCSMKKNKPIIARSARELAKILGLSATDGLEIEIRSDLNDKIVEVIKDKKLTHAQVARLARTSRTRVTALVNRNTKDISTDLMLRILSSLGVYAKIQFKAVA
jgi:predicted XRE-type DNA-binding protein